MLTVHVVSITVFIVASLDDCMLCPIHPAHYQTNRRYFELQSCLVNLDISMLDLNEAVRLCLEHGLSDGLLYVYNRGLQDYVTPLQELLLQLRRRMKEAGELDGEGGGEGRGRERGRGGDGRGAGQCKGEGEQNRMGGE